MTLVEHLSRLHREVSGCLAILYGDMATRTVLRACANDDTRQEIHDAHLAEAASLLGPEGARLAESVLGNGVDGWAGISRAIRADLDGARFFLRAPGDQDEVLCVILAPGAPLAEAAVALCELEVSGG